MGFFGSLGKLVMDVVETPIAITKDIVTLGGALTESDSYTVKKLEDISEDWEEMKDGLDD